VVIKLVALRVTRGADCQAVIAMVKFVLDNPFHRTG
jgi:hypothetical protein